MKRSIHATVFDPEFDRLRNIKEIYRSGDFLDFLDNAQASLGSSHTLIKRDIIKRSLLHYAAMGNCSSLLQCLLQHEPDLDSRDIHGRTPLHWAAEYGSLAAVNVLLDQGASVNALDYRNSTPLSCLVRANSPAINSTTECFSEEKRGRNGGDQGRFHGGLGLVFDLFSTATLCSPECVSALQTDSLLSRIGIFITEIRAVHYVT